MISKKAQSNLVGGLMLVLIVLGIAAAAGVSWKSSQEKTSAAQSQATDIQVSQALAGSLRVIAQDGVNPINITFKNVGTTTIKADSSNASTYQVVSIEGDQVYCDGHFSHNGALSGEKLEISLPCCGLNASGDLNCSINAVSSGVNTKILLTFKPTNIDGYLFYLTSE